LKEACNLHGRNFSSAIFQQDNASKDHKRQCIFTERVRSLFRTLGVCSAARRTLLFVQDNGTI